MKRYEHCKVLNRMIGAPDGEWVKCEDVEMLLSEIQHDHAICLKSVNHDYKCPAYETTEKARGEAK